MYEVRQYPGVLDQFRIACAADGELIGKLETYIYRLKEEGPDLDDPDVCEYLRDDIWQLRPQKRDGTKKGRVLFYWEEEKVGVGMIRQKAVIVCAFFKTTKKTPDNHIETAKRRRLDLQKKVEETAI